MVSNILWLVVSMTGLTIAADRFVVGAAQVAARLQVSTVVTGALIIGFGTSAPELVVSSLATWTEGAEGTSLAIGNIVGSNVANLMLVLPIPALVFGSVQIEKHIEKGVNRQAALSALGVTVFAALLFFVEPSFWWGAVLLFLTVVALQAVRWIGDRWGGMPPPDSTEGASPWAWTVVGLVGTVGFAYLVVWSATSIADDLGWTGGFVGFALVAVGTSLPELVTALAAARRGESGLILGNLLGSNLFNSLMVGAAVFLVNGSRPYDPVSNLPDSSLLVMVVLAWLVILFMITGRRIARQEALLLIVGYAVFLSLLATSSATV